MPGQGGQCSLPVVAQLRSTDDLIAPLDLGLGSRAPKLLPRKPAASIASGGETTVIDLSGPRIAAANLHRHWEAVGPNDIDVPSPNIAAGPSHILVVTSDDFAIYTKRGDMLFRADMNDWFSDAGYLCDPVAFYDTHDGRFVFCVLKYDGLEKQSDWIVCVSDDDDPLGYWHWYRLSAVLDGGEVTNNYARMPSMGFDYRGVYLTADMHDFDTDDFQYAKMRILDKSEIYNALPAHWHDFWGMYDDASTRSSGIRACRAHSYAPGPLLVSSNAWSGDYVVVWLISDPFDLPSLSGTRLAVWAYSYPPDAHQQGSSDCIYTGHASFGNAVYYENHIYAAHAVAYDWGSDLEAVFRYYKINVGAPSVVWQEQAGGPGVSHFDPVVSVNRRGDMIVICGVSGAELCWPGVVGFGRRSADPGIDDAQWLREGTGPYSGYWWGYYFGASLDGGDMETMWGIGQYAETGDTWGTYVAEINFDSARDTTPPADWNSFYTTQTTSQRPDLSILVRDLESGLYPPSASYEYSNNGGGAWEVVCGPDDPICSGDWGSTSYETISADSVAFDHDSMSDNLIRFHVEDMYCNESTSPTFTVQIDSTGPEPWGAVTPSATTDQTPDLSVTIRDATSGLHVTSGLWWCSRDGGSSYDGPFPADCTGSDWTTSTETMTAYGVPFNQDSMAQNAVCFWIQDMFDTESVSGWLTVEVDATPPGEWGGFTPSGVVNGGVQTCTVETRDVTCGLNVGSAEYRWSNDHGDTWSEWLSAACTGGDGTTAYQTLTAADVQFDCHSLDEENLIEFRVVDMFGNIGYSGAYAVRIDGLALVRGHVTLADWVGDPVGMLITLELLEGSVPVEVRETTLTSSFDYEVWFGSTGGTQMRGKPSHHLSYRQNAVLSGSDAVVIDWSFPHNGDVDGDDTIALSDLNEVLVHFGASGVRADVDGSGTVDLPDLNSVLINFGKTGM
jgi:hypothetical protein